jgi:hypothetical protein
MASMTDEGANQLAREPRQARRTLIAAVALWVVPMLVVGIMVALQPWHRTVTPTYHRAVARWWAQESLYSGFDYHYLPHFAVLFTPFHLLPVPVGDLLWRFIAAALVMGGLWRITSSFAGEDAPKRFLQATVLAVPLCMPALRNGQANAMLAGLFLQAAACLPRRQWWPAVLCMVLAVAIKQLGVVMILLAAVVYAPLRWRLVAGLALLTVLPFLFGHSAYVIGQHQEAMSHLRACAEVTEHRFADINGILRTFGTAFPATVSKLIRALAGGLTLGLWWLGARRLREPLRALWLYALATGYLMLFNPMTEANSYAILAPVLGAWGAVFLHDTEGGAAHALGWGVGFMALTMGLLPNVVRPLFGNNFALFWHPTMTIAFLGILIGFIWRREQPIAEPRIEAA